MAVLQWTYAEIERGCGLVAENLPNYRAEIIAINSHSATEMRAWSIYERHRLVISGTAKDTQTAKRWCDICIDAAQKYPCFDQ